MVLHLALICVTFTVGITFSVVITFSGDAGFTCHTSYLECFAITELFPMEYTPEQLNYFRVCYIAFNLVPEGLRKVFKLLWNFRYKATTLGEWKDTPQNGLNFHNNESKKSRSKNARYLVTIQNGNTAEWDCSCLFFAILFSDSIGISLSPALNKDVDDLRQVRNDIAHISEAELSDVDFKNYVGRVLFAFNSLGLSVHEIEAVKNQTTFPTAEVTSLKIQADNLKAELRKAKSDLKVAQAIIKTKEEQVESLSQEMDSKVESFCNLTVKPCHEIIIRQNDVTRILRKIKELEHGSEGAISTIYLSGIPGCGKTQIARQLGQEFFRRQSQAEGECSRLVFVATFDAESLETLADSYIALAKQLGITEYALTNLAVSKVERPKETIEHLKRFILSKTKAFSKWLIIADNVVDVSLIRRHLPETGSEEWGNGQVLITTQDTTAIPFNAPSTWHESLSAGMQPDDAVQLLREVSHISNQAEAEKVAEVLEYQPLALAAAAFYVQTIVSSGFPSYSWTKYLEALEQGKREATEEPLAKGSMSYSRTMTTAVKLALHRTVESDEVLRHTFSFLQLCASESVPIQAAVDFVEARTTGQTEELIRAKILKSSFILCLSEENEEPRNLRVHNVVHDVLQKVEVLDPNSTERFETIAASIKIFNSLLDKEIALSSHEGYTYAQLSTIVLHCKAILDNASCSCCSGPQTIAVKDLKSFIIVEDLIRWLCSAADVCCKLSDLSHASFFSKAALNLLDSDIGKWREGSVKAHVFTVHGKVLSMQCHPELSIPYHEEALRILDTIQAEDKLSIVITNLNNLGRVYKAIAQQGQAKAVLEKALDICKSINREDNFHVATSYSHLGLVYNDMGQHTQAKELHEKALVIRKKAFGEEHGDVAASYSNLGSVSYDLGQYTQAKEFHERALAIRRNVFGEEHCDVAASYNNLGLVAYKQGQYEQARESHKKALAIRRKVFGESHGDVLASYNNLGLVSYKLGQYSQAREMHEKALMIGENLFAQNPCVAASYNNLGLISYALGKYAEAKEFYEKALIIRRETFGENHREVAASYNNLGVVSDKLREYGQSKEFHEKALTIRKNVLGEEHRDVAASYNNLGVAFHNLRQYNEARSSHTKALIIRKKIFGEHHRLIAKSYDNLGSALYNLEQYDEAKESNVNALIIRQKVFGEDHVEVASSCNKLGFISNKLGQQKEAKQFHDKALKIERGGKHLWFSPSSASVGATVTIGKSASGTYSDYLQYSLFDPGE